MNKLTKLLLIFIALNILDIALTYILLGYGYTELNPIARFAFQNFGTVISMVSMKGLMIVTVLYSAYAMYEKYPMKVYCYTWMGVMMFLVVVVNNIYRLVEYSRIM